MNSLWPYIERDPLWRREMRERWRRPITLFLLALYAVGLSWVAYSLYRAIVPPGAVELGIQSHGLGHRLFMSLLGVQIFIWIPIAFLLGAPTIAAERERHALTEYLLAGLATHQIVLAKFASLATFIVVMCAIPLPLLALCFPLGGVEPAEFFGGFVLEATSAIACAAVGILISTHNRRVPAAMQNAVFLAFIFLILALFVVPNLLTSSVGAWFAFIVFLALGTSGILTGCVRVLDIVARHLEQDEQGSQLSASTARPTPPRPSLQSPPADRPRTWGEELLKAYSWDLWIENVSARNAVAQREVRVGLRASRVRMELSPDRPNYQFSPWVWVFLGVCGLILVAITHVIVWWHVGLAMLATGAIVAAAFGSSAAFTREREQKMLAQLRACPLSPVEVVAGKIGAMLLLVARSCAGPFLGLLIVELSQGVFVALGITSFLALGLLFAVTLATLFSLVCHRTEMAASISLGVLGVVFVLLPLASGLLIYIFPILKLPLTSFPLGPLWIEPMGRIVSWLSGSSLSPATSLFRLSFSLGIADSLLFMAATFLWSRAASETGEAGISHRKRDAT